MKDFKNGAATPRLELSSKFIFWERSPFVIEFHELLEEISFEDGVNVFFGPLEDNAGALDLPRLRCKFVNRKDILGLYQKKKNILGCQLLALVH